MSANKSLKTMWQDPPSIYRSAPFWSWNAELEPERLCRQIDTMHAAGMGGFFMHSRYGLKTKYLGKKWFDCIAACIDKARKTGMKPYLYDEDRWPSGAAGGAITRSDSTYRLRYLVADTPEAIARQTDDIGQTFGAFEVIFDKNGLLKSYHPAGSDEKGKGVLVYQSRLLKPSPWENDGTYIDTMNPEAVAQYIRSTHDQYANRFAKSFGSDVLAIFTDEPNYGAERCFNRDKNAFWLPWTDALSDAFKKQRGYDLLEFLPELFTAFSDGRFSKVRHDYYSTITALFVESFTKQIGQWCDANQILLTGHMLMEGTLRDQIEAVGACMPHYAYMQWPGIDLLTDQCRELATAKQCSSVADQLGKERVLTELYGCTGWDWPLEGHKYIADWQFAAGINFLCPHLTHYSLAGGAKRDYPASIIDHSPWWTYYKTVQDYLGRISVMLTQGSPVRDVLVVHPIQSAWGLFGLKTPSSVDPVEKINALLESIIYALSGAHYDWDFADETLLAKYAKIKNESFIVGKMRYKLVVVPPLTTLRPTTVKLLEQFISAGGLVVFAGSQPTHVDGRPSQTPAVLRKNAICCGASPKSLVATLEHLLTRRVSLAENGKEQTCLWAMLRQIKGGQLLFVQSHDRKKPHTVTVTVQKALSPVIQWDALSGRKTVLKSKSSQTKTSFELDLPSSGSAIVTMGMAVSDAAPPAKPLKVISSRPVKGPFEVTLSEPNTLPLDYCRFRIANGRFSSSLPTLEVDRRIHARYGLSTRLGFEQQPWYLYAAGKVDTAPRDPVQVRYAFHVTALPSVCHLASECPQDYTITINGRPVGCPDGYWVDEDIQTIDIAHLLKRGQNVIEKAFVYRPDMELEDMYLVGDFSVMRCDASGPIAPDNITLDVPINRLRVGSWVGQGLDFYTGSVYYKVNIQKPKKGTRLKISLPKVSCTAAAVHIGKDTLVLPWAPFEADITDLLDKESNPVSIELIGGRKNTLGPLHVPPFSWTEPGHFSPEHSKWTDDYQLTHHGLMASICLDVMR